MDGRRRDRLVWGVRSWWSARSSLVVRCWRSRGYLVANWGFTLTHTARRAWHLRRGLLTTRETSLDDDRVGGVSLGEPLGLRLAGGGRLARDRDRAGPQAAGQLGAGAAGAARGRPGRRPRGARHRRRRSTHPSPGTGPRAHPPVDPRAGAGAAVLAAALVVLVVLGAAAPGGSSPAAAAAPAGPALAADRCAVLGHALADGHLVAPSGSLDRHRQALDTGHVIGWTFRSTWFQRRAGLTTLVATTAGGSRR